LTDSWLYYSADDGAWYIADVSCRDTAVGDGIHFVAVEAVAVLRKIIGGGGAGPLSFGRQQRLSEITTPCLKKQSELFSPELRQISTNLFNNLEHLRFTR